MNVTEEDGLTPAIDHPLAGVSGSRLVFYLLPFVVFPVLLLAAAFLIVPTRWFILHSGNTYMANMGYAATLHNSGCQVVLYGDSTALTSADPALIEQRTGLKTCDIAEFEGMTTVNGTMLVDEYLRNNPRPRFLIFMYTPEDLGEPPTWTETSYFEALTYRLQHERNWSTAKVVLRHPADTINWAEQGLRMALLHFHSRPFGPDHLNLRNPANGALPLTGETLTSCDHVAHNQAPQRAWIDDLRVRYGVDGTRVLVEATPAPSCDASLPFIRNHLPPEVDDLPYPIFPLDDYLKNTRLHMNAKGTRSMSLLLAAQISRAMGSPAGIAQGDR